MNDLFKLISLILAITTFMLFLVAYDYRKKNKQLEQNIETLKVVNAANMLAINTLKKSAGVTDLVIAEWVEVKENIIERQKDNKSEIQKEIKGNDFVKSWSDKPVPDSFILLLERNSY